MTAGKEFYDDVYTICIVSCKPGDIDCITICARILQENLEKCPCKSGCPNGCPCPEYICPETTTSVITTTRSPSQTSVLILNTRLPENLPIITNLDGKAEYPTKDFMFLYGSDTEVYGSCSILWQGRPYIFGGVSDFARNQISTINGCKLQRISSLPFHHYQGSCANMNETSIYLCFNGDVTLDKKRCRIGTDPTGPFTEINQTSYAHSIIRLGVSEGQTIS